MKRPTRTTPVVALIGKLNAAERQAETLDFKPAGERNIEATDAADNECFDLVESIIATPAQTVEDVLLKVLAMGNHAARQEKPDAPLLPNEYFWDRYEGEYKTHLLVYHMLRDLCQLAPTLPATIYCRSLNDGAKP